MFNLNKHGFLHRLLVLVLCTTTLVLGFSVKEVHKNREEEVCRLNVMSFGAKGDGKALDTAAITATLKAAKRKSSALGHPHCTIQFPSGHVFLTAPLNVSSYLTLEVQKDTILRFPSNRTLHPVIVDMKWGGHRFQPLIFCENGCVDLYVTGEGTLDGQGPGWWPFKPSGMGPPPSMIPPILVECENCMNFQITAIRVVQCPFVCLHAGNSSHVLMKGITVSNPIDSPNTACVYADSLHHSRITNSTFSCGDDHITVLAITRKTINVTIDHCLFHHGQGLTIGSQVAHGLTNVTYKDIVMKGALTGIRLKAQRAQGGHVMGLRYENIQLRDVGIMMTVEMDFIHSGIISKNPPIFNNVVIKNITGWGDLASFISCIPESPCNGWELDNVFSEGSSEVVLPYHCENFQNATCRNCGSWPKLCKGITPLS